MGKAEQLRDDESLLTKKKSRSTREPENKKRTKEISEATMDAIAAQNLIVAMRFESPIAAMAALHHSLEMTMKKRRNKNGECNTAIRSGLFTIDATGSRKDSQVSALRAIRFLAEHVQSHSEFSPEKKKRKLYINFMSAFGRDLTKLRESTAKELSDAEMDLAIRIANYYFENHMM